MRCWAGGGRGRCTEHNFTFVVSYYTLRCNRQFFNVFISSPLLLSSFLDRLLFLWSKLWCCYCNSVIHTLILCKIWQYEIKHLKSQICTFTGCMSDHLLSTQLLNMYRMPHRTILALSFWIFSKGWEDVGYSNQWYIKKKNLQWPIVIA